ncbi:alpha/beta hydrolase [Clostridium saccharoperbutylacetonicum]|uniref:alpha/beta hydrolase n=1 Tax=Clostridium saccharoperbutylacetonicum TaxID=36745 RepID=UPI0039EC1C28
MINKKIQLGNNENVCLTTYVVECLKQNEKKPAIVVCPGGGYLGLSLKEKECVAIGFNQKGYHAFTLEYSTLSNAKDKSVFPEPLIELAKAIKIIKENSDEWNVDTNKISIIGFSAGANLAANYGVYWNKELLKEVDSNAENLKINTLILCYPLLDFELNDEILKRRYNEVIDSGQVTGENSMEKFALDMMKKSNKAFLGEEEPSIEQMHMVSPVYNISPSVPPTFVWHTFEDGLITVQQSLKYASKLKESNIPCELHIYEKGQHGLSLADETSATKDSDINKNVSTWFQLAVNWLKLHE